MSVLKRNHAIIRTDKTLKEYREKFGHLYDEGSLVSYTKEDYENRFNKSHSAYRSNQIKEYWVIDNLYYEVPELTVIDNEKPTAKSVTKVELSEKRKISFDMMHYRNNRSSFWLILLTIALNVAMFIIIYKTNTDDLKADLQLGFDLIINVVFMLTAFLAAEKTKRYSREWGIVSFVLGGVQVARIFWIPLYYYLNGGITPGAFSACVILLAGGAACMIIAGALTLIKYRILKDHEPLIKKEGAKKDVRT
ncbi:MAG: hypothetical protein MJ214_02265 [Bacilli bacterium]|nr:hypothetical protein [Bacilli bacterium]